MTSETSFLQGFNFGRSTNASELTNREVTTRWPDTNVDSFVQGHLDGLAGDRWRADRLLRNVGPLFSGEPARP